MQLQGRSAVNSNRETGTRTPPGLLLARDNGSEIGIQGPAHAAGSRLEARRTTRTAVA